MRIRKSCSTKMKIHIYTLLLALHLRVASTSSEMSLEDTDYIEDTQELLDTLPEAIPETEEEEDPSSVPSSVMENALEELPEPEAYRRRRPRPKLPTLVVKTQGPPQLLPQGFQDIQKDQVSVNDFYKSSLDNVQMEKHPTARDESSERPSSRPMERLPTSYETTEDPLTPEESWKWFSTLLSSSNRRHRNGRPRGRPYLRRPVNVRARNRPRDVLDKRRPPMGRQNVRRPAAAPFRPRTQRPAVVTRPRYHDPTGPRHRPTPSFVVTDPTTTPPDTLSVHNIAGPPYYDTIPPNILFMDEEMTTPMTFAASSLTSSAPPLSTTDDIWRPVSPAEPRWTYSPTTQNPIFKPTLRDRYVTDAERGSTNRPRSVEDDDDKWKTQNIPHNDFDWNVDTDEEWFNIWNHNWGDEWGRKWETATSRHPLTTNPSSGYPKNTGNVRWEDGSSKQGPENPKNKDLHSIQSLNDQYSKENMQNHRLPEQPVRVMKFPDSSSDNRYTETSERPLKFPDMSQAGTNMYASVNPSVKFPKVPFLNQGSSEGIQNNYRDTYSVNSRSPGHMQGNSRYNNFNEDNRRISTTTPFVKGENFGDLARRHRPHVQYVDDFEKSLFITKKPLATIRQITRGPRPKQPAVQAVIVSRLPPHVWTPNRRLSVNRRGHFS